MRQEIKTDLTVNDSKQMIFSIVEENSNLFLRSEQLIYSKEITTTSHWQKTLIVILLADLSINPLFHGSAFAITPNFKTQKHQLSVCHETLSSTISNSQSSLSLIVCYTLSFYLTSDKKQRIKQMFRKICGKIHSLLEEVMRRYKLENMIAYWRTKFRQGVIKIINQQNVNGRFNQTNLKNEQEKDKSIPSRSFDSIIAEQKETDG